MLKVGEVYTTVCGEKLTCVAVTDTHAWMKSGNTHPAYVWTQEGMAISLSHRYHIKMRPREYWVGPVSRMVFDSPAPGAIHVREVVGE